MINATVNDLDTTLTALADPTRRHVVELLRDGPLRASELAEGSGMSRPAMSRHLRVLRASGLVEVTMVEDDARGRIYELRPERFVALQAWLDQVHAFWSEQLGSFKEHAESGLGAERPAPEAPRAEVGAQARGERLLALALRPRIVTLPRRRCACRSRSRSIPTPRSRCSPRRSTPGTGAARTTSPTRRAPSASGSNRVWADA